MIFWSPRAISLGLRIDKTVLFIALLFNISFAIGQQSSKQLQGRIVSDNADVTGITIQNSNTERATITDFEGNFSIQVREGDTLVFSAVQFKRKILPVSKALMNSAFVQIPLEEFVNELDEVTVQPFGLSGDISKDLTNLQLAKDVSAEALDLPNADVKIITQSERKLFEATTGSGLVPLNPILNWITGRTKMLKNRVAIEEKYGRTQQVRAFYVDSLFTSDLGVPAKKIDDFMYFCEIDDTFQELVSTGDQLRLWEYLLDRSKLYRKNNGLD